MLSHCAWKFHAAHAGRTNVDCRQKKVWSSGKILAQADQTIAPNSLLSLPNSILFPQMVWRHWPALLSGAPPHSAPGRFEPQRLGFVEKDWGAEGGGGEGGEGRSGDLGDISKLEHRGERAKMVEKKNTMVGHCCSDQVHPQPCTDFWNGLLLGLSLFTV